MSDNKAILAARVESQASLPQNNLGRYESLIDQNPRFRKIFYSMVPPTWSSMNPQEQDDFMQRVFERNTAEIHLEQTKDGQKAVLGFFMFLALALIWIANGVLMDPLWQTTKVGDKHIMSLHKDTQVGMIKMFTIMYWIFFALSIVMSGLTLDKARKESSSFMAGIFYLCLSVLSFVGIVGAGYLTSKVWSAKQDPTNKQRLLLTFSHAQLTTVKIMCILIWADIVFGALLFIWKTYNLK